MKMVGLWIDKQKSIIVNLNGKSEKVETLYSEFEGKIRIDGESKQYTRLGKQFFPNEKSREEKNKQILKKYYESVISKIKNNDSIIIIGPAEAKKELYKQMATSKELIEKVELIENADSMTDNQVVATLKKYFEVK